MKKILLSVAVVATIGISSCGGNACDNLTTAENAATCACEKMAELKVAEEAKDEEKIKALEEEISGLKKEVKKNMKDEVFAKEDFKKASEAITGCDL